jgi:hypothetical protein
VRRNVKMNLNVSKRKNGRVYLYIERGYRDKATGQTRHKIIKTIGYVDELEKEFPDPVAHFREVARKMTEEENKVKKQTLTISLDEQLEVNTDNRKNFGYAAILKIYHELELDKFLKSKARPQKFEFNTNSIMILLLVSRILSPGSKVTSPHFKWGFEVGPSGACYWRRLKAVFATPYH